VPEGIERDAEDARAYHVLAMHRGHAIGTGRLVQLPEPPPGESGQWFQIGRMAVLQASRKQGVGSQVLRTLETEARRRQARGVMLHAQLIALEFYKRHEYQPVGAVFEEAGMPHLQMQKKL
jgi:predicted GNAT family N-acyltransferase